MSVTVRVNGSPVKVEARTSAAAAIAIAGGDGFRRALSGGMRGPVCGMGICFECRATVDGVRHVRTCMVRCRPDMEIETDVD